MHCAQCCLATTLCARGCIWTREQKLSRGSELRYVASHWTHTSRSILSEKVLKFNNSAYSQTNIYFGSVCDYHFTLRAFRKRLIKHFHLHFLLCGFIFYPRTLIILTKLRDAKHSRSHVSALIVSNKFGYTGILRFGEGASTKSTEGSSRDPETG